jgi:ribonuclease HI
VNGHTGARYKSFKTLEEAQEFVSLDHRPTGGGSKAGIKRTRTEAAMATTPWTETAITVDDTRPPKVANKSKPPSQQDVPKKKESLASSQRNAKLPAPFVRAARNEPTSRHPSLQAPGVRVSMMFDGGARGNPGVAGAGAGVVIFNEQSNPPSRKTIHVRDYVGLMATNNNAEYRGLVAGLKVILEEVMKIEWNGSKQVKLIIQGDSKLIIKQIKGEWQVKNEGLKPLYRETKDLIRRIENVCECVTILEHVYRDGNKLADSKFFLTAAHANSWGTASVVAVSYARRSAVSIYALWIRLRAQLGLEWSPMRRCIPPHNSVCCFHHRSF